MTEIEKLSENALPEEYLAMTGEVDEEDAEDEFMDFMLPANDEENLSNNFQGEGGIPCTKKC